MVCTLKRWLFNWNAEFSAEKSPFSVHTFFFLLESDLGIFRSPVQILPVTCLPVLEEGGLHWAYIDLCSGPELKEKDVRHLFGFVSENQIFSLKSQISSWKSTFSVSLHFLALNLWTQWNVDCTCPRFSWESQPWTSTGWPTSPRFWNV